MSAHFTLHQLSSHFHRIHLERKKEVKSGFGINKVEEARFLYFLGFLLGTVSRGNFVASLSALSSPSKIFDLAYHLTLCIVYYGVSNGNNCDRLPVRHD